MMYCRFFKCFKRFGKGICKIGENIGNIGKLIITIGQQSLNGRQGRFMSLNMRKGININENSYYIYCFIYKHFEYYERVFFLD